MSDFALTALLHITPSSLTTKKWTSFGLSGGKRRAPHRRKCGSRQGPKKIKWIQRSLLRTSSQSSWKLGPPNANGPQAPNLLNPVLN